MCCTEFNSRGSAVNHGTSGSTTPITDWVGDCRGKRRKSTIEENEKYKGGENRMGCTQKVKRSWLVSIIVIVVFFFFILFFPLFFQLLFILWTLLFRLFRSSISSASPFTSVNFGLHFIRSVNPFYVDYIYIYIILKIIEYMAREESWVTYAIFKKRLTKRNIRIAPDHHILYYRKPSI